MKKGAKALSNPRLRDERERRGWSQKYVAAQIGAERYYISRWECGVVSPSPYYRSQLCALFSKSASELGLLTVQVEDQAGLSVPKNNQLEPYWYLPYKRNPFFTGRETSLALIAEKLQTTGRGSLVPPLALSGLGGIGKSQLVIEYAYRFRNTYRAVFWVRAESQAAFISDVMAISALLQLPLKDERNQGCINDAVKRWLIDNTGWLLILDNVEDFALVNLLLPADAQGHIILTTLAQSTGAFTQRISLEPMSPEEGTLFLLRRSKLLASDCSLQEAPQPIYAVALQLSSLLEGLPLALDQAGAYIEETGCSLQDYLNHYQKRRAVLLGLRGKGWAAEDQHPQSMSATLALIFERVERANPAAAELLRLCAFLHPNAIPEEMICEGATELGPLLSPIAGDGLQLDRVIASLRTYSLIDRHPETKTLTIHRLAQAVLKDSMPQTLQRHWAERVIGFLLAVFPDVDPTSWQRCQRALAHAMHGIAFIEQWQLCSLEAARLLFRVGMYFQERAQYGEAEPLYEQALALFRLLLGSEHAEVLRCLDQLAILHEQRWDDAQAETLYQQVLQLRIQTLGAQHASVALSLSHLASLYFKQGKYTLAGTLHSQALAIREQLYGPVHLDVAASLIDLAALYREQGDYLRSEPLYQRSLAIREQQLGSNHLLVALTLRSLGIFYHERGRYAQAKPFYQRSLAIHEQLLGPDHPHVALSMRSLAMLLHHQGHYSRSEVLHKRALAIRERAFGHQHPFVADTLNMLAELYSEQGRYEEAKALFMQAMMIWESELGPDHPDVAHSLDGLAQLYCAQGKYVLSKSLSERALGIRRQTFGEAHPVVAQSLMTLASLAYAQDAYARAEVLTLEALAIVEEKMGPEHPQLADSLSLLARLASLQHRYEEAELLYQRTLAIQEAALGSAHPKAVENAKNYAVLLRQKQQHARLRSEEPHTQGVSS